VHAIAGSSRSMESPVESGRALYWGVASAAAVCSLYGTVALAKRGKIKSGKGKRERVIANGPFVAFKKLRRKYAQKLRPLFEDLVYLTMFILNLLIGVVYSVLDFLFEPRSSSATLAPEVSSRPRRGAIKRLRPRWAWVRSRSKPKIRQRCDCWGWVVEDLTPEASIGLTSSQILQDEIKEISKPRWSECQCKQCAPLLMPMRKAVESLHVFTEENAREFSSETPKPFSVTEVAQKKAERTALIFIHGMFSSATFWFDTDIVLNLSDDVKEQHRILAPDLLGCGRSPRPVDSLYTLADQIEAIERSVIQKYELESFHLVGHSMGSIVALALAARAPQRVRSITLIAPVYPPCCLREDGELAQIPCDAFFSFLDPLTLKGVRALTVCKYYNISRLLGHLFYAKHKFWVGRIHGLLKRQGYPRSFIHDYLTIYHDAAWHIAHNSLLAGTHAVIPALQKLRDSGHQILVIHGEIDTSIQFRLAEEMSCTFSNVELVGVPEKGHVDVVWGRAHENALLIEKAIRDGDKRWSSTRSSQQ